jgi:hypothetical protein
LARASIVSTAVAVGDELISSALSWNGLANVHVPGHAAFAHQFSIGVIETCTLVLVESHVVIGDVGCVTIDNTVTS